ncbi:MAG TPA: four helix bundle protein [Candidatus Magasanikbacteria bacterium]|nr:four helix bundle protein [Candidatus Magasanikbacteria bacterium]
MAKNDYHQKLRGLIVEYIVLGYKSLKKFPDDEKYGMISQCKRALVSILLNYLEGFARTKKKVMVNFYEISYGSLQETIGIFYLAIFLEFISKEEYKKLFDIKEEIARMLWSTTKGVKQEDRE